MNGAERRTAIDLLHQDEIWVDSQGNTYQVAEMELRYVRNVRDFLLRNGRMLAEQMYAKVAFGMQPSGDMASDAYDAILEELTDATMDPRPWLERSELVRALSARLDPAPPQERDTWGRSPEPTYVEEVRERLVEEFPKLADEKRRDLLDLYTLLVLIRGEETEARHVHDAWAVRMAWRRPDHWSLVPYDELPPERQEKDDKYVLAIRRIARELKSG